MTEPSQLIRSCGDAVSSFFAGRMPIESPPVCMLGSVLFLATAACLLPKLEACARISPLLAAALNGSPDGWQCLRFLEWTMIGSACACAAIFQARCLQLCYPEYYDAALLFEPSARRPHSRRGIEIAGMPVDHDDLRTSILVTGVTGSSKTAGVLMPALAQLFQRYREETEDEFSRNEFQKIGAFIPEVKGDLVEGCIYLAHEAGRCVSRDVLILSPSCRIPVVRYRDERGRFWFLSARGGSGGSDAGDLLPRLTFPPGHPRTGRWAPPSVYESAADLAAILPELVKISVPLGASQPRFIGWRWRDRQLLRVSHTAARDEPARLRGPDGRLDWAQPRGTLTVDGVIHIDNGVHYNLVDARLPAAEAAERITRLAAMARGGERHGENDYFYEQGRKLIAACIALHREVEATPCTAVHVVRLAVQDDRLGSALAALDAKIERLKAAAAGCADEETRRDLAARQIVPAEDLAAFFRDEWQKMVADGKTANVIKSTISGAFDVFLRDPNLAETFCQPSTFSFEDVVQSGKIIGLIPGDLYEQLGRLLGTACKLDFQSTLLSRNGRPDLNSSRLALYFADECHKYVISGSSTAGDPYFMNLSRSNNVVNICATQSYAWIVEVLGREAANVYLSAFGVQFWLQQTDPETCRRAAEICGTITREKVSAEHNLDFAGLRGALRTGREIIVRHQVQTEEKERFRAEDFAHLDVGEIVAYNKGREGRIAKVTKGRSDYLFCTRKPEGAAAVNACVRDYYRDILENLTQARGQSRRWDGRAAEPAAPVPAEPPRVDPPEIPVAVRAPLVAPAGLTAAGLDRERADFAAWLGGLDETAGQVGGTDPSDLAVAMEEARRKAEAAEHPGREFGAVAAVGLDGLVAGDQAGRGTPEIRPDAGGQIRRGDLAFQVAARARLTIARQESRARSKDRREQPRPRPDPGAFDAETMRQLASLL